MAWLLADINLEIITIHMCHMLIISHISLQ